MNKLILSITIILSFYHLQVLAGEDEYIKIAAIFAKTGKAVTSNAESIEGIKLAVERINQEGGILNKKLKVLYLDNKSTTLGSIKAAELAARENVFAIIGAQWSDHSLAIATIAETNHIPMISSSSTHTDLTKKGKFVFRVCISDDYQGKMLASYAMYDQKARTAITIYDGGDRYSIGLSNSFKKEFKSIGGKVISEFNATDKEEDVNGIIDAIVNSCPDIVFLPLLSPSLVPFIEAKNKNWRKGITLLSGDGIDSDLLKLTDENISNLFCTQLWHQDMRRKESREFVKWYLCKFPDKGGQLISSDTVLAYEAVFLLKDAVERAGTLNKEDIRVALANTRNFDGITNDFSFDSNGDPNNRYIVIGKFNRRDIVYIKTLDDDYLKENINEAEYSTNHDGEMWSGFNWKNLDFIGIVLAIILSIFSFTFSYYYYRKKHSTTTNFLKMIDKAYSQFSIDTMACEERLVELNEQINSLYYKKKIDEQSYTLLNNKIHLYLEKLKGNNKV